MKAAQLLRLGLLIAMLAEPALSASEPIEVRVPGKSLKLSLTELKSKLKVVTVTIDDPVYKQRKSFDGVRLLDLLKLAGFDENAAAGEVVFTAKDGYAPNTSMAKIRKHNAVLTFQEHGKTAYQFEKVAQGKAMVTPAPYYLVWEEGEKLAESVPWPYQLAKIEVINFRETYAKLYPQAAAADSTVMQGFVVFKNHCLRCHSINLQGGDLGPELNAPQNVTEYWAKDVLKRFIRDASSFRYKTKMPPFTNLPESDIDNVITYLEFMKADKRGP